MDDHWKVDTDSEFEERLKQLSPVNFSDHLEGRIRRGMERTPSIFERKRRRFRLRYVAGILSFSVGVAAGFLIVQRLGFDETDQIGYEVISESSSQASVDNVGGKIVEKTLVDKRSGFIPTKSTGYLYEARDEGVIFLDGTNPARGIYLNYLEVVEWTDRESNMTVRMTLPREELRVVPIKTF